MRTMSYCLTYFVHIPNRSQFIIRATLGSHLKIDRIHRIFQD